MGSGQLGATLIGVTRPAGRAAVEIIGDASKLGPQLQRDVDKALRDLHIDLRPLSTQIANGISTGIDQGAKSFDKLDTSANAALREVAASADDAFATMAKDVKAFGEEAAQELATVGRHADTALDGLGRDAAGLSGKFRPEFAAIGQDAERAFDTVRIGSHAAGDAIGNNISIGADRAQRSMRQLSNSAAADLTKVRVAADAAGSGTARFGGGLTSLQYGLLSAGTALGAGVVAMTTFGLKSSASLEQTRISFNSLLGSVDAGAKAFKDLQAFANATPFEFKDVAGAAARFYAFSGTVGIAKSNVTQFLTTIGNVASVTGGGAQALNSVTLAMGQIASAGKVTLDNLNQISEALPGFSGVAAIAAGTGQTTAQVMQEISKGTLDATTGLKALLAGMDKFPGAAGAMDAQAQTLLGVFSTFKDTVSQALVGAFEPVIPAIKASLLQVTPILGNALNQLGPALGSALATLLPILATLVQAITPVLTPIINGIAALLKEAGNTGGLLSLGKALGDVATALSPIFGLIGGVVAGLAAGLAPVLASIAPSLAGLATLVGSALKPLIPVIVQIGQSIGAVLLPIGSLLGDLFKQLGAPIGALVVALGSALAPVLAALGPVASAVVSALLPFIPILVAILPAVTQLVVAATPLISLFALLVTAVATTVSLVTQFHPLVIAIAAALAVWAVVTNAVTIAIEAVRIAVLAWEAAQVLLDIALNANPIGLIIIAIAALVGLVILAWRHSDTFRSIVIGLWHAIESAGNAIGGAFLSAVRAVGDFFASVGSALVSLPGKIGGALAALPGLIGGALAAIPGLLLKAVELMFTLALRAIGIGIGLVLAAIIGSIKLIVFAFTDLPGIVARFFSNMWARAVILTVNAGKAIGEGVVGLGVKIGEGLKSLFLLVVRFFADMWTAALAKTIQFGTALITFAIALPGRIGAAFLALPGIIRNAFLSAVNFARIAFESGLNNIIAFAHTVPGRLAAIGPALLAAGKNLIRGFMSGLQNVGGFFSDVGSAILRGLKSGLNAVIRSINSGIADIDNLLPFSLPRIPQLASGGLTTGEGLANLHPRELVLPLDDQRAVQLLARALAEADAGLRATNVLPPDGQTGTPEQSFTVHVFIGDKELTDMVKVEISEANRGLKRRVQAGARRS